MSSITLPYTLWYGAHQHLVLFLICYWIGVIFMYPYIGAVVREVHNLVDSTKVPSILRNLNSYQGGQN